MRAAPQPEQAGPSRPDTGATSTFPERDPDRIAAWRLAVCLSLGSAIALGLARFSYALLLPPMKADLGWTFAQAGALNTANAAGSWSAHSRFRGCRGAGEQARCWRPDAC